jgi:hypothetical protein
MCRESGSLALEKFSRVLHTGGDTFLRGNMPKTRQKPTQPDSETWALSPQQETAVGLLASGKTVEETAQAVGMTRQTVVAWLRHPGVQAALNGRRQELWAGMTDRLRGLLPKALDVLAQELEGENPVPVAVHILKACGLYGLLAPDGPVEPEEAAVAEQERVNHRKQRVRMVNMLSVV